MLVRDEVVSKALDIKNVEKFKKRVSFSSMICSILCSINFEITLKFPSFNQNSMTFQCMN